MTIVKFYGQRHSIGIALVYCRVYWLDDGKMTRKTTWFSQGHYWR